MTLFKILMSSTISKKGARCTMINIKDFYLCMPMKRFKYTRLKMTDIPEEIITEYGWQVLATNENVYCKIQKGMYGLLQSGIIAQELLEERLARYWYFQLKIIPGFWTHKTRPICSTLVVDNFTIKFTNQADATHLIEALKRDNTITVDREAN